MSCTRKSPAKKRTMPFITCVYLHGKSRDLLLCLFVFSEFTVSARIDKHRLKPPSSSQKQVYCRLKSCLLFSYLNIIIDKKYYTLCHVVMDHYTSLYDCRNEVNYTFFLLYNKEIVSVLQLSLNVFFRPILKCSFANIQMEHFLCFSHAEWQEPVKTYF